MERFCFIFAICYFTGILIFAVYLRSNNNRVFYEICKVKAEQSRLKQQLWQKQLQLESLISPSAVSERIRKRK